MNKDNLQRILSKFALSSELESLLLESMESFFFSNDHMLIQEEHIADSLFIVENGIVISHTNRYFGKFSDHSKSFTTMFWGPGDIIFCPYSFLHKGTSKITYQVVSDGEIYGLHHSKLDEIYNFDPLGCSVFLRDILMGYMEKYKIRVLELQSLTAWERYTLLLKQKPGIELMISQEVIASYLGITPQSLSRLRKNRN